MTLNKSHILLIASRRERVAQLRLRGLTQRDIVEALARSDMVDPKTSKPYSLATINSDLQAIETDWRDSAARSVDERKAAQLAELAEVKRTAWTKEDMATVLKAIAQETELLQRDAGDFLENFIGNDLVEVGKSGILCAIGHQK